MKDNKFNFEDKIANLNYDERRIYELTKANTKLVTNTLGHVFVAVSVIHLALATSSILMALAGGYIAVKTVMHGAATNKEIGATKKLYKK